MAYLLVMAKNIQEELESSVEGGLKLLPA